MELLLYAPLNPETDILKYALQQSGLIIRVSNHIDQLKQTWTTQPADAVLAIPFPESPLPTVLVKEFRSFTSTPLMVITDLLSESEIIAMYQAGADLVINRPYSLRIMAYQLRALIQRSNNMPLVGLPSLTQGSLELDPATRSVSIRSQAAIHLTQLEFRMLYTLMTYPERIFSAEELVENIWGYQGEGNRELVRGLIQRLRAKIEPDPRAPIYILTEAGVGYYFYPHIH